LAQGVIAHSAVPASEAAQDNPRELVVKMVQNELASQKQPRYWMYLDSKENPGRTDVERVIQTPSVGCRGRSQSTENRQQKKNEQGRDHMESLVNDARLRRKNRDEIDADSRKSTDLLKILPDAFLFTVDAVRVTPSG